MAESPSSDAFDPEVWATKDFTDFGALPRAELELVNEDAFVGH